MPHSKEFGARLRKARLDARLTLAQVAAACGDKTPQAVSKWERGSGSPNPHDLYAISQLTGADLGWLISGHTQSLSDATQASGDSAQRGRVVPSVEWADIAGHIKGTHVPRAVARSHFPCGPRSFQSIVEDRSNEPLVRLGDSVIIDPDKAPTPGSLVLVLINGQALLRRYRPREDHIELAPSNSDWPSLTMTTPSSEWLIGTVSEISHLQP